MAANLAGKWFNGGIVSFKRELILGAIPLRFYDDIQCKLSKEVTNVETGTIVSVTG
uniref:Uncharacterized protein n=1 Tax=uncultured marine virus TaxID=186617 RepID=A0A0F7L7A3_9VIRU|nr:hypothetical protein [uncultured marine virus]